jgi:thiazolylpeptide-type bacteriocin precursor
VFIAANPLIGISTLRGETKMNYEMQTATVDDVQGLEIETFKIEELTELDVNAAVAADLTISLCSSTTSSSCG